MPRAELARPILGGKVPDSGRSGPRAGADGRHDLLGITTDLLDRFPFGRPEDESVDPLVPDLILDQVRAGTSGLAA